MNITVLVFILPSAVSFNKHISPVSRLCFGWAHFSR